MGDCIPCRSGLHDQQLGQQRHHPDREQGCKNIRSLRDLRQPSNPTFIPHEPDNELYSRQLYRLQRPRNQFQNWSRHVRGWTFWIFLDQLRISLGTDWCHFNRSRTAFGHELSCQSRHLLVHRQERTFLFYSREP